MTDQNTPPNVSEFGRKAPTGLADWIRALPVGVPTLMPPHLSRAKSPAASVQSSGLKSGVWLRVLTRADGLWVLRTE